MNYFSYRRCFHYRNGRLICLLVASINDNQWPLNMAQVAVSDGKLHEVIGMQAFYDCKSLKHIYIPENVRRIGYEAFAGCDGLAHIEINNGVEKIAEGAFCECKALKTAIVPYISSAMFVNCYSLTDVWVTNEFDYREDFYVNDSAFENCNNLRNIWVIRNKSRNTLSHVVKYFDVSE